MRWFRILWAFGLGIAFVLSVAAAIRGGFVGADYNTHLYRLTQASEMLDFSTTDPPLYYLLGRALFKVVGRNNAFPITLSILQAAINTVALWWLFLYSEKRFRSRIIHLAFAFFLTFLPVRLIHAVTIGTDCLTVPVFVLVLFLFNKFLSESTSTPKHAAFLGLGLALGICSKYSFMALLPAVFVIFLFLGWKRRWSLKRFAAICALGLVLPSAFALENFWASAKGGYTTGVLWHGQQMGSDMNFKDLLSVKAADLELFKAPDFWKEGALVPHKFSYLGLSHVATFTDPMNLFQVYRLPPGLNTTLIPNLKTRRPWKTRVMQASVSLGTVWTMLALIGTVWLLFLTIRNLYRDNLEPENIAALLGVAYFLLMFLPIPFVHGGFIFWYWFPRLILPALVGFFWAAFLFIDRKIAGESRGVALFVLLLVMVQCGLEVVMLT